SWPFKPSSSCQLAAWSNRTVSSSSFCTSVTALTAATTSADGSPKRLRPCNSRDLSGLVDFAFGEAFGEAFGHALLDDGLVGDGFFHGDDPLQQLLDQGSLVAQAHENERGRPQVRRQAGRHLPFQALFHPGN